MGQLKTFQMKLSAAGIPILLILLLVGRTYWLTAVLVSAALVIIAYLLGDIAILPATNNLVATAADAGLALLLLWAMRLFGVYFDAVTIGTVVVVVALLEGMVYHPYLKRLASFDAIGPTIGRRK